MRYAALETSSRRPSVAVREDGREVLRSLDGDRPHASDLLPALEAALGEFDFGPAELDAIVVGTGPGSYTGLRVGIATALGLARGSQAVLIGIPSPEALVWGELEVGTRACVLLDARAGELYLARYERTAEGVEVVTAPCVLPRAEAGPAIAADRVLFADAAALRAADVIDDGTRTIHDTVARADHLLELGARRLERDGPMPASAIQPLYLRAFAAKPRKR